MSESNTQPKPEKKEAKSQYKIAETVTAEGPKRPKPKDTDSNSESN
jgi:hypothetical protein